MKPVLFNLTDAELSDFVTARGLPKFRGAQIREWLSRGAPDFASMKTCRKHYAMIWTHRRRHCR